MKPLLHSTRDGIEWSLASTKNRMIIPFLQELSAHSTPNLKIYASWTLMESQMDPKMDPVRVISGYPW